MKHIHFLGITGSGASAVAAIAQARGYKVDGCDKQLSEEFGSYFNKNQLMTGHSSSHLTSGNTDMLVITPAVLSLDPDNEEIVEAKKLKIPILTWQEFLGKHLLKNKFVIAVSGTHGKSTTTAMVAKVLEDAGLDPTIVLGAVVPEWGKNHRVGKSKYFVIEADEFNDNFLNYTPDIAVVTTIEIDHPEYFKDFDAVQASFIRFLSSAKDLIIANVSDPGVGEVLKVVMKTSGVTCIDYSKSDFNLNLKVIGSYNRLNASAAFHIGLNLGIDVEIIRESLESFAGIGRRMEKIGEINGAQVFSDFGHHPTEIKVTLEAVKQEYPDKRIITVFQPHMFSRTYALFTDFVQVFKELHIDLAYILDIYPSREIDTGKVTSKQLVEAINKESVIYIESYDNALKKVKKEAKKGDIVIFLGAGDTHKLARQFLQKSDDRQ